MEIIELTVANFRPYYGEVTIEPRTDSHKPLILVLGKNDTGKTSLFTALRFCLYGAGSRDERSEHINRTAVEESDGTARVEVTFTQDEDIFTIERGIEYNQTDEADDRRAIDHYREVRGPNGKVVGRSEGESTYRKFINRVLPENVSRFFLFDAEELQRFEQSHDETVRESIETVLGIQEIENAIGDLEDRKTTFDREFANYESTADEVNELREELQEVMDELDEIGNEDSGKIADLRQKKKTKEQNLSSVRTKLEEIEGTEDLRNEKQRLESSLEEDKTDLQETKAERNELRKQIGPIIAARGRQAFRDNYDIEGSSGEADFLHELLDRDECVCGDPISDEKHEAIFDRYQQLRSPQRRRLTELMNISRGVDTSVRSELNRYTEYQASIRRVEQTIEETQADIDELQDKIDQIEEDEKADLKRKESTLTTEIGDIEKEINDLRERRGELKSEQQRLENRISGMDEAESEAEQLRELSALAERCRRAFEDIKTDLVESRRESVEKHASDTFLQLTNRPDYYEGLEITGNYELRVLTPNARRSLADQDPSAGQTQIIAYSFIAGLSQYTTRNAPVVIDTPIGRLDPEHKANLVDFYHEFSDQVIILYQPNELDEDDIEVMQEYISKHYQIKIRDDDSSTSTIEELPEILVGAIEEAAK
jgi:DNA sulfur modification protein DndD